MIMIITKKKMFGICTNFQDFKYSKNICSEMILNLIYQGFATIVKTK